MTAKALYFPYIRTPEDEWFTRVLLYWDAVGTILPGGLEDDERYVTPRMRELREEGLLEEVRPVFTFGDVPNFRDAFLAYLDGDETVQQQRVRPLDELSLAHVHVWKLGNLANDLIERGLARFSRGAGWELWLDVEERTADLFMAYLAATLGALQEFRMDPVTNRGEAMAALLGVDTQTGLTLKRARELRLGVLEDLLPAPAESVTVKELAKFKRDHGRELAAFRDHIDEELMKVAMLAESDASEEQARIALRRLLRERDEIAEMMERRRWPRILFGSIAGLGVAAAALAAPLVVGGGAAAAAFAAPGLVPAVYAALADVRTRPDFGNRPMAYAALAQRRFVD